MVLLSTLFLRGVSFSPLDNGDSPVSFGVSDRNGGVYRLVCIYRMVDKGNSIMDFVNHGAWGFVIADKLNAPLEVSIPCAVICMAPDLIGYAGGSLKGNWKLYNWAHQGNWLWILPPYLLHIGMDYPAHINNKKYWWHSEIISWIILCALLLSH